MVLRYKPIRNTFLKCTSRNNIAEQGERGTRSNSMSLPRRENSHCHLNKFFFIKNHLCFDMMVKAEEILILYFKRLEKTTLCL